MTAELDRQQEILEALQGLRQELGRLSDRVAALEAAARGTPQAGSSEVASEELLLVIGAAVAAYLGKKPRIRQVRLLSSPSWAQHGRATIQASHALPHRHA